MAYLHELWEVGEKVRNMCWAKGTYMICTVDMHGERSLEHASGEPGFLDIDTLIAPHWVVHRSQEEKSLGQLNYEAVALAKPGDLGHRAWEDLCWERQEDWDAAADVVIAAAKERGAL